MGARLLHPRAFLPGLPSTPRPEAPVPSSAGDAALLLSGWTRLWPRVSAPPPLSAADGPVTHGGSLVQGCPAQESPLQWGSCSMKMGYIPPAPKLEPGGSRKESRGGKFQVGAQDQSRRCVSHQIQKW